MATCHSVTLTVLLQTMWWLSTSASVWLSLWADQSSEGTSVGLSGPGVSPKEIDDRRVLGVGLSAALALSACCVVAAAELAWEALAQEPSHSGWPSWLRQHGLHMEVLLPYFVANLAEICLSRGAL